MPPVPEGGRALDQGEVGTLVRADPLDYIYERSDQVLKRERDLAVDVDAETAESKRTQTILKRRYTTPHTHMHNILLLWMERVFPSITCATDRNFYPPVS